MINLSVDCIILVIDCGQCFVVSDRYMFNCFLHVLNVDFAEENQQETEQLLYLKVSVYLLVL